MKGGRRIALWGLVLLAWMTAMPAWSRDEAAPAGPSPRLWQLADRMQARDERRGLFLDDRMVDAYLQKVSGRLWARLETGTRMPAFRIAKDARNEAHTYPNGYCRLTTGLLSRLENEDQLAMLLAHEMIHYFRQHAQVLYDSQRYGDVHRQTATPRRHGQAVAAHIDAAEEQADREGLTLLAAAGYRPHQALRLLSILKGPADPPGASRTRDRGEARMARMKALVSAYDMDGGGRSVNDPAARNFLRHMAPIFLANAQAALEQGRLEEADRSVSRYLATIHDDARAHFIKGEIVNRRSGISGRNPSR